MENLLVNVDGISKEIYFEHQEDGWYLNKDFQLLIDPEVTYCITDQKSAYSCLPVIQFRVLDYEC